MPAGEVCIQIKSSYFTAGVVAYNGRVIWAAPTLKIMNGMTGREVRLHCEKKGWTWERVPNASAG